MKRLITTLTVGALFSLGACERHSWEDVDENEDGTIGPNEKGTYRLYKEHHGGGHGEEKQGEGDHAGEDHSGGGGEGGGKEKH